MRQVYLDNNATTPVDPLAIEAMLPYLSNQFGNASSIHTYGQQARGAVEESRQKVAALIGASPSEVIFTAGGTESDNFAVRGVAGAYRDRGNHIITSQIEHPAVLRSCEDLESEGFRVSYLEVDSKGLIAPQQLADALCDETILVSLMHANNEIGVIQPIEELAQLARARGVLFHTDAVQSAGKRQLSVAELGVDLLSISSHKLHGPKGVGALYVQRDVNLKPLLVGGSHERSRRAGTENVPGVVGFGVAAEVAMNEIDLFSERVGGLRDRLEQGLLAAVPDASVNGDTDQRMPHVSNISFLHIEGEALLIALDFQGVAVSTGAACSSGSLQPSHVLAALKLARSQVQGAIRFSLSRMTSAEEIDYVLEVLPPMIGRMRDLSLRRSR